jgi:AAA+ superfamily predicted ATPase
MSIEPALLQALEAAVVATPENVPLRVHLASLLVTDGRAREALQQCQAALAIAPDDQSALALASTSARLLGDSVRADAYARLVRTPDVQTPARATPVAESPAQQMGDVLPIRVLEGGDGDEVHDVEIPDVRLADVGGMEQVKRRLEMAFLAPMRNPQLREMYGKSLRGGLLLFGPPGCGKTFIARATAGELGARFIAVGLSDVLDMYFGQSERNLHELFETARRKAPCVLFLDEVDALGQKRTNARNQPMWRSVVAQLLNEMDSVSADNEGVFILGATNAPWDVDAALRRPGRFDRMLLVLPPDRDAREAIVSYHLRSRPVDKDIDRKAIASRTEGYSGADLAHACESAAEFALEDSLATGVARPINADDLGRALKDVRPSTGAWFQTARNFAMFANEGGLYDDLLDYMRAHHTA